MTTTATPAAPLASLVETATGRPRRKSGEKHAEYRARMGAWSAAQSLIDAAYVQGEEPAEGADYGTEEGLEVQDSGKSNGNGDSNQTGRTLPSLVYPACLVEKRGFIEDVLREARLRRGGGLSVGEETALAQLAGMLTAVANGDGVLVPPLSA